MRKTFGNIHFKLRFAIQKIKWGWDGRIPRKPTQLKGLVQYVAKSNRCVCNFIAVYHTYLKKGLSEVYIGHRKMSFVPKSSKLIYVHVIYQDFFSKCAFFQ